MSIAGDVEAFRRADDKKKNSFFVHTVYLEVFARLARKVKPGDFTRAHGYIARDEICRLLAEECYELVQKFANLPQPKYKLSLQYMKLASKLLGLSLRPKKLQDLEEIKRALAKLKAEKDGSRVLHLGRVYPTVPARCGVRLISSRAKLKRGP